MAPTASLITLARKLETERGKIQRIISIKQRELADLDSALRRVLMVWSAAATGDGARFNFSVSGRRKFYKRCVPDQWYGRSIMNPTAAGVRHDRLRTVLRANGSTVWRRR